MSALLWGNPLALLGVALIAVPILVHLLATYRARRVAFPTLRFLPDTAPTSARTRALEDPWLLLVRCLIVALAAAALAQPWFAAEGRDGEPGALAVVVDISASMSRNAVGGQTAAAQAQQIAADLAGEAETATTISTLDLAAGARAAAGWLADEGGGELVLVSDFQRGAIDATVTELLADNIGLRLIAIPVAGGPEPDVPSLDMGATRWAIAASVSGEAIDARWRAEAAPADRGTATAADRAAARVVPIPSSAEVRPVSIVWSGEAGADDLPVPDQPWMADVVAALPAGSFTSLAARDDNLVVFTDRQPDTVAGVELAAAVRGASVYGTAPLAELEPETIAPVTLESWERPVPQDSRPGSDARWVWGLVLVLLAAEWWMRRRPVAGGEHVA